jgi:hypothetical protein
MGGETLGGRGWFHLVVDESTDCPTERRTLFLYLHIFSSRDIQPYRQKSFARNQISDIDQTDIGFRLISTNQILNLHLAMTL